MTCIVIFALFVINGIMDTLTVNCNGYIQVPDGYHIMITRFGSIKLVKDIPIFKKGDVIQYNDFVCVVDHVDHEGCINYSVLMNLKDQQITYNSTCSIAEFNYKLVTDKNIIALLKTIDKTKHNL